VESEAGAQERRQASRVEPAPALELRTRVAPKTSETRKQALRLSRPMAEELRPSARAPQACFQPIPSAESEAGAQERGLASRVELAPALKLGTRVAPKTSEARKRALRLSRPLAAPLGPSARAPRRRAPGPALERVSEDQVPTQRTVLALRARAVQLSRQVTR